MGRFTTADSTAYHRGQRVIVRTPRGIETGIVLSGTESNAVNTADWDGEILRRMTVQDELLAERLERHRREAIAACEKRLARFTEPIVLVDAELSFDGGTLFFYFLGEPSTEVETSLATLAEVYQATAQMQQFADTLTNGCGPDCGTGEGGNCQSCGHHGESDCETSCAVAELMRRSRN